MKIILIYFAVIVVLAIAGLTASNLRVFQPECSVVERVEKNTQIDGWETVVNVHLPTVLQKLTFYTKREMNVYSYRGTMGLRTGANTLFDRKRIFFSSNQHIEIVSSTKVRFDESKLSKPE